MQKLIDLWEVPAQLTYLEEEPIEAKVMGKFLKWAG